MKASVAFLAALAGAVLLTAQTTPAKPAKPPEKEEPPIPGIVIARPGPDGNQLGLTIENGTFKLSFYDKKRKPIPIDVTRALARWNPPYKAIPEQTVLNPLESGKALGDGLIVRPPYAFKLHLILMKGEGDDEQAVETYVVTVSDSVLAKK